MLAIGTTPSFGWRGGAWRRSECLKCPDLAATTLTSFEQGRLMGSHDELPSLWRSMLSRWPVILASAALGDMARYRSRCCRSSPGLLRRHAHWFNVPGAIGAIQIGPAVRPFAVFDDDIATQPR